MKQVAISSSGEVCVLDVPIPMCEDEGILVRVSHSLISSGTEMVSVTTTDGNHTTNPIVKVMQNPKLAIKAVKSIIRNGFQETLDISNAALNSFQATGYSSAGVVVEVGKKVRNIKVGDRVACAGVGYANHAQYNYVPQNLVVPIPGNVTFQQASFVTLGAIAMQGVRQAKISLGENVLVVGLGLLGQITIQMLRSAGCRVLGVDLFDERIDLARQLSCHDVVFANDPLYKEKLLQFTHGLGFDAVILTAGTKSSEPINSSMDYCRDRARVVVVGDVGLNLERGPFFKKELEITISRSYGPGRYDKNYEEKGLDYPIGYARWTENRNMSEVLRQISEGLLNVNAMISEIYPVDQAFKAYGHIKENARNTIAVLLDYDLDNEEDVIKRKWLLRSLQVNSEAVGFGVIGAGDFVKAVHLPNLKKNKEAQIIALVTRNGLNSKQLAEQYQAQYCATDYRELLADHEIKAVILGTRHHLRKEIIIDLALAGKHIYVEKPLALTYEDCLEIEKAVADNGILLTVGFNRRFSKCAQSAYDIVSKMDNPKIVNYRINAGFLPPNHWLLDPEEGGGRIVGEGVHFFDFISWMVGGKPVEVLARGIVSRDQRITINDNLVITIVYDNGSIGSIQYTGMGHTGLSKERIEIYCGNAAIVIDDFKSVQHYGTGGVNLELQSIDKGLEHSLSRFIVAVQGKEELLVTVQDGTVATWCAEQALQSLNKQMSEEEQ